MQYLKTPFINQKYSPYMDLDFEFICYKIWSLYKIGKIGKKLKLNHGSPPHVDPLHIFLLEISYLS